MSKLVAYLLYGQDNDTFMFDDEEYDLCPVCGYKKEFLKYNPHYVPKQRMRDYSSTYDGFSIVTAKFRDCISNKLDGVLFEEFDKNKNYLNLRPEGIVEFDYERSGTRFIKKCNECGNFESVVGIGRPPYLKVLKPISRGIFRTDLFFGSGSRKNPLTIVGIDTKRELESCGLRGLEFFEAHGLD